MEAGKARQFQAKPLAGEEVASGPTNLPLAAYRPNEPKGSRLDQAASSVSWRRWSAPRQGSRSAVAAVLAGLMLRLGMLRFFPQGADDGLLYGDLARNLLLHGSFALTNGDGGLRLTLIRLPGYP